MKILFHLRLFFIILLIVFYIAGSNQAFCIQEANNEINEDAYLFNKKTIENGDVLSLQDCVSIAFYNSPEIKKYKYRLDIAKSNVGTAKSEYFPVIGAGVGFYNENNTNNTDFGSHTRDFPSVSFTVNKLIWNFGKTTSYIKMEEFYKIGAEYEFMDSLCRTLFDVKEKYYAVLSAQAKLKIYENRIALCEKFYNYTKNLAQENDLYEDDMTNAQLNLNDARIQYTDIKNDYRNAIVDLNNAMYIDKNTLYSIKHTNTFDYTNELTEERQLKSFIPAILPFDENNVVDIAYKNSPDLKVLESTQKAMENSLQYVKKTYFPDLYAGAGYGFTNGNHYSSNNSLSVGVNLSSSINVMNLRHSIKRADALVKDAENEISYYKKNLYFTVKKAMNNLDKFEEQIPLAKQKVENANEHLKTVLKKYKSEDSHYTAMQNAIDWQTDAMIKYIEILYSYNIALIGVEEATHSHIIDIHHKSKHAIHHHENELIEFVSKWMNCDEKEVK